MEYEGDGRHTDFMHPDGTVEPQDDACVELLGVTRDEDGIYRIIRLSPSGEALAVLKKRGPSAERRWSSTTWDRFPTFFRTHLKTAKHARACAHYDIHSTGILRRMPVLARYP